MAELNAAGESLIQYYKRRRQMLWNERSPWIKDYKDISEYLLPRTGRFMESDRNQGSKRNTKILDSSATKALDVLSAGLMAGMTSPARPWFRLGIPDDDLEKFEPVQDWLFSVTKVMRAIFSRSNTYRGLHSLYEELGAYGTASTFLRPDFKDVLRLYPMTVGEYAISTDARNEVTTVYREIPMTIAQVVEEFGRDNVSVAVKTAYERRQLDQWVTVVHCVEPRPDNQRDIRKRDGLNMPFASCYFEASGNADKPLRESGFKTFPALVPRWATRGNDIYGEGPGFSALPDIIQLQHEQLRKARGIDYQTDPPLQVPLSMKGRENDLLPGGMTYVDMAGGSQGIKTAFEVQLNLQHLLLDLDDVRRRIDAVFYKDLFLMLANDNRSGITATEVAERHEEKLLMLGPVTERLNNELHAPLIDATFEYMVDADLVPPPPKELEGMDLKVEFIGTLAQAQRAVGLASVGRLLMTVGQVAQAKGDPGVWDKLDTDSMIDGYGDMLGVDPQYIVGNDKVVMIRQQRAQAQQAQQAAEQMPAMAQAAANLSSVDTSGNNALTDVMRQFSGYSGASPA